MNIPKKGQKHGAAGLVRAMSAGASATEDGHGLPQAGLTSSNLQLGCPAADQESLEAEQMTKGPRAAHEAERHRQGDIMRSRHACSSPGGHHPTSPH